MDIQKIALEVFGLIGGLGLVLKIIKSNAAQAVDLAVDEARKVPAVDAALKDPAVVKKVEDVIDTANAELKKKLDGGYDAPKS